MPCRALEAFRLIVKFASCPGVLVVLMPCRALEAFRQLGQKLQNPARILAEKS